MKLLQLKIAAIGLLILIAARRYWQHTIKIYGTLTDLLTHEPIEFATAALLNRQTKLCRVYNHKNSLVPAKSHFR